MTRTEGEYRVGVGFNPSGDAEVTRLKGQTAVLIDTMHQFQQTAAGDAKRCAALAMTAYEEAAMWAVKAITKPPRA